VRPLVNYELIPEGRQRPSVRIGQMSSPSGGELKAFLTVGKDLRSWIKAPVHLYVGTAVVYTQRKPQWIWGASANLTPAAIFSVQFDGRYPTFGLTSSVGKINGSSVRLGILAVKTDRLGPFLAIGFPLGR
jgi:hypothetical protein